MNPLLATAIQRHIETYQLGDIVGTALVGIETASTKKKKGFLSGKAEVILTGAVLTPQWLIWAAGKEGEAPAVMSAKLSNIQIQDYEKSEMHKLIEDSGLNIMGLRTDSPTPGSAFIGLGPELAAQKFRRLLKETAVLR